MLDAVSTGLHPSAIITQLSEKYDVTERVLWSDRLQREKWVPLVLDLEKYAWFTEVRNRLEAANAHCEKGVS